MKVDNSLGEDGLWQWDVGLRKGFFFAMILGHVYMLMGRG